ncbi:MAG: hypothetical protein ACI4JB_06590 [Porcipelethomonas sp.]
MVMIDFYKNTWHGSFCGTDEELILLLSRSADTVNNVIAVSGYTVDTVPEVFKARVCKAVCAHADYIDGNGGIESLTDNSYNSVSLGKFSYSADSSANNDNGAITLCPLAQGYLAPTGLLYRGAAVL